MDQHAARIREKRSPVSSGERMTEYERNNSSRSSVLRSCSHSQPKHLDYKRRAGPGMGDQVDSGAIDQEKQYRREEKESEIRACGHSQVNAYGRHLHISI